MARIRTIKPEAFTSESLAAVSLTAERTFVGLLTQADDHGRHRDHPAIIAGQLWPLRPEHTPMHVEQDLIQLVEADLICRYTADDGKAYLHIVTWHRHQKINRPSGSRLPACPHHDQPDTAREPACERRVPHPRPPARTDDSVNPHGRDSEPSVSPHRPDLGPRTMDQGSPPVGGASAPAPQTASVTELIAGYVSACAVRPPKRVIDHLGREVKQLLTEGVRPEHIRAGLTRYAARPMHPSVLPSLVNEAMNPTTAATGTAVRQGHTAWTNPADASTVYAEEL